jgi:hypothetical protein
MKDDDDFFSPPVRPKKRASGAGRKRDPNRESLIPVSFKMSKEDHAAMLVKAGRHANGNVSEWLRESSTKYFPAGSP